MASNKLDALRDTLEALIDHESIVSVLEALADIAYLKAEHVRENWQDETLGKAWDKTGDALTKLSDKDFLPY